MESSTLCLPKMSKRQSAFGLSFLHNSCRYLFFSRQCWQLWLKTSWIPLESITSRKRDCRRCFWVEKPIREGGLCEILSYAIKNIPNSAESVSESELGHRSRVRPFRPA